MKKVNLGVLVAATTAFTVLTALIIHIFRELKELNEALSPLKYESDEMPY